MTRDEKIETLENFCDEWVLCSDGCPFWKERAEDYDCRWHDMNDKDLDECIDFIGANDAKKQIVNPSDAKPDMVNHPTHYCQGGIECIDAIKAATVNKHGIEAVCVANVIKYIWRYETKNGLEDVRKAAWYIDRLIKELEAKGE